MKKKYLILLMLAFIISCTNKEEKESVNTDSNIGDRISTHESDWEKYSKEAEDKFSSENYKLGVEDLKEITDKSLGSFTNPKFSFDGKFIVFTNQNYSQIWMFNFESSILKKIVDLPQCGYRFQISSTNDEIYFRNKADKGKQRGGVYTILRYLISQDKIDVVYNSDSRISSLSYLNNTLFFLERDQPKQYDLENNKISENFNKPFFFVENNYLIKMQGVKDTISFANKNFKFINCEYSKDGELLFCLTANNGILAIDFDAKIINQYDAAQNISKLYKSNLVAYTEEKDDGLKVTSSNMKIGFIGSAINIDFDFNNNEKLIFTPDWSPTDNKIAYTTDNGIIMILSFNIEKISK